MEPLRPLNLIEDPRSYGSRIERDLYRSWNTNTHASRYGELRYSWYDEKSLNKYTRKYWSKSLEDCDRSILENITKPDESDMSPMQNPQMFDPVNLWSVQNDV